MPEVRRTRSFARHSVLAALVAVVGPLLVALLPRPSNHTLLLPALCYLVVVAIASALGRLAPGLLAAALGLGLLTFRDLRPLHLASPATGDEAVAILVFGASAVIVSMLVDRIEGAKMSAERSADRLARLQSLTAALSNARSREELADIVVGATATELGATRGSLSVVDASGENLQLIRSAGISPSSVERFRSYPVDAALPASEAFRTKELLLLANSAERDRRFPAVAGSPPEYDHALALVPLVVDGQSQGVISLSFDGPRSFPEDDRQFLLAVGHQCAQGLERARLHAAEDAALQRQTFLAEASRVLASSLDYQQTLSQVTRLIVPDIADSVSVHLLDGDELALVILANADPDREDVMRRLSRRDGNRSRDPFMLTAAVTGEPRFNPEIADDVWESIAEDREHLELLRRLGTKSGIVVPLWSRDRPVGVLALGMCGSDRQFAPHDLSLVLEVGSRVAVAIDNALAHRARSDVARTLQRSLLPPQPLTIPGLELASCYHPISDGSEVGGDFFDVFPAGESPRGARRWGIVMGDVCGKGVEAAALTALTRYTVRAVAPQSVGPSVALHRLNRTVLDYDPGERFCTVVHAMVEVHVDDDGRTTALASLASGGHPLPLLLRPDGSIRPVGRPGGAIGLFPAPDLVDTFEELQPGDTVVFYTDGVTEARSPSGAFAPELLRQTLVTCAGMDAEAIVECVERAVIGFERGRLRDDFALLVVRVPETASRPPHPPFYESYPPIPATVTLARRQLGDWLARVGEGAPREDILLASSELVSNAVRAARTAVGVRAWVAAASIVVEVSDDGPGFDTGALGGDPPAALAEQGRGLFLVTALMDDESITSTPAGTTVTCRKRFR